MCLKGHCDGIFGVSIQIRRTLHILICNVYKNVSMLNKPSTKLTRHLAKCPYLVFHTLLAFTPTAIDRIVQVLVSFKPVILYSPLPHCLVILASQNSGS